MLDDNNLRMKIYYKLLCAFLFCLIVMLAKYESREDDSDLVLANVEAVTSPEVSETTKTKICYNSISYEKEESRVSVIFYCGDCTEMPYTSYKDQGICKIKK